MLDTFEILTTSGVVLWSRSYSTVSPSVINHFITDVFIEEKASAGGMKDDQSAATNPPYKHDQHTLRWTFVKELGIIFVAVYRSLLHLQWIDKLVDNIKTIFVSLYGDQLKKPNTTIVECIKFDEYFDQQLQELEAAGGKGDAKGARPFQGDAVLSSNLGDEPPLPPGLTFRGGAGPDKEDKSADSTPIASPNTSRPSTPAGPNHLVVGKAGPVAKMSRRARKVQNSHSAPASSGDEAPGRRGKKDNKAVKKGRKWGPDGVAYEDENVQLDYSKTNALTSDSEAEAVGRSSALEEVDSATWGSKSKGKFVLKDLGEEVHSILASADAKNSAATAGPSSGLVGSSLSAIGGLFRNVVGGKVLTQEDLDKAMKGMEEHLLKKNVAREAAIRLCEGVEKELVGSKTGSFESTNARIQAAMEASLTKMLTPTSSLDLLREIDSITSPSVTSLRKPRPYVMSIVGVNGVGKSTNLSKICFFLLQNQYKVLIAAGDTFRSGAVEQLAVHVRNLKELTAREGGKVELYQKGYGKDAANVAKDAVAFAAQEGYDVVLIDTAGRRHNDQRLMSSLEKFAKFANPDKILMVGEALVGTDSVAQARNFNAAFGSGRTLDGFIISKCDTVGDMVGTLVSIVHATNVPVFYCPGSCVAHAGYGNGGPPPSTLAAQLVENISSTTTRSSRPDETGELKRLFDVIERVKNYPELLKSPAEREEHNHMLIYICARVNLEGPKWDLPSLDSTELAAEALKAVKFFQVTIQETPSVLTFAADPTAFLFRGNEPLWVWLLPKVLKLLGHPDFASIKEAVEGFCGFVLSTVSQTGILWELASPLMSYFQESFRCLIAEIKYGATSMTTNRFVECELPPRAWLHSLLGNGYLAGRGGCTHTVVGVEQAIGYSTGILAIVNSTLLSKNGVAEHHSLLQDDEEAASLRQSLCLAMIRLANGATKYKNTSMLISSRLMAPLHELVTDNPIIDFETDFWRCFQLLKEATASQPRTAFSPDVWSDKFTDERLRQLVQELDRPASEEQLYQPAAKRLKVSQELSTLDGIMDKFSRLMLSEAVSPLDTLGDEFLNRFAKLSVDEQCQAVDILARMPCAAEGTLTVDPSHQSISPNFQHIQSAVVSIFERLVKLTGFIHSRRPRVVAMIALQVWDLEKSALGQWCVQSLTSSIRELRVAAGRLLAVFLREPAPLKVDHGILRRNRANALAILKSIADRDTPPLNETVLLEYLGHRNTIVSALAFNEILNLADGRGVTARELFEPFWNNLALAAVKDLVSRPQTTRTIAELLQVNVSHLLKRLQHHALPYLVLNKKRDVIQKITEARGEEHTFQPCLDLRNLPGILALLISRESHDVERDAMKLLHEISPHFDKFTFADLLKMEPIGTSVELLKAGGEADGPRKARCRAGLALLAKLVHDDSDTEGEGKKRNRVGRFIQSHALGVTPRLTEIINDPKSIRPPVQEQIRCIRAMEELVIVCKSYVRVSRPEMAACLLSALAVDDLRPTAFSCWQAMLMHFDEEDVEALIETTFFITGHYWKSFDEATQRKAKELIQGLLDRYPQSVQDWVDKLPSLSHIPELVDLNRKIDSLRKKLTDRAALYLFSDRLGHDNPGVAMQALSELSKYLKQNQVYIQTTAMSEQPDPVVTDLMRALLDCSSRYNGIHPDITRLSAECIGLVGCLDSNRLETTRKQPSFVVISNFEDAGETTSFIAFTLEHVLVKSFLAATDTRLIGFLSYTMQELLEKCDFKAAYILQGKSPSESVFAKWQSISEGTREVLLPFMASKYVVAALPRQQVSYPIIQANRSYGSWLRTFVLDLLHSDQNPFASFIFGPLQRVIKVTDGSIAEFLLPYVVLHVVVGQEHSSEFRDKLQPTESSSYAEREEVKRYYEACFRILDYCMRWVQLRKSQPGLKPKHESQIKRVEQVIKALDPELLSRRAVDCRQYARALFFLEPHIFQQESTKGRRHSPESAAEEARLLQSLSDIYTQIDDPDGLEGVSARLPIVDIGQQTLNHRKAGRWTAAQTWYEIRLAESPENVDVQLDLLTCLKESGQHDVLLNYVEGMKYTPSSVNKIIPFAVEASWATGRWRTLEKYLNLYNAGDITEEFNLGISQSLLCLERGDLDSFRECVQLTRDKVASSMSHSATSSLRVAHDALLKCHALGDLEMIAYAKCDGDERRVEVLGAYVGDKQYLLGIRRAAMQLMRPKFENSDISSLWLSSARLARKSGSIHQSFNAVLHAQQLGDSSATIENARLLWKEGHHRKAIEMLQGAIKGQPATSSSEQHASNPPTSSKKHDVQINLSSARAHLLLAKWLDSTGQAHASALRLQYQQAAKTHSQWEKGHYYLGRHYKKVLESEKMLKTDQQSDEYVTGETAKLVIENYMRSLNYGTKYLFQTLPRILTLWLELGMQVDNKAVEARVTVSRELQLRRKSILQELHKYFHRHLARMPAFIFYTALPQMVARIAHPNAEVFKLLEQIIVKVVEAHPRQALWSLFACMTPRQTSERRARGQQILNALRGLAQRKEGEQFSLKQLLRMGEKLADQLLLACNNGNFQSNRNSHASITRDLHFNHKCTPCPLVVPIEKCLTATLPTITDVMRKHQPFSRDLITIEGFLDEVYVLGSLAKPRRLTARGSDGQTYMLLVKPKDDLRTDQRLMEFNAMINRSLKRDAESSRRQLYIKTYAVTPLNEECGIIEWVDGLKTLRDILLNIYGTRGIKPNYTSIASLMKEAMLNESNVSLFTENVLGIFPPVLQDWFTSQFPSPDAWFAARLTYTRSCAVMSMVGTILGLGDRHGENILLEEGNGGVFHVDFNCLFDKGLTFAQPERVPFRLTHNMVAAMGIYGYEGPFRQCSELTLRILRQQEETLVTILEAFIYDPTLDLQRDKKRKNDLVILNPTSVVESIKRKLRGLLPEESIPLGVEGQVEELIKQATDPKNLTAMYIGWCPFL
ncbi:hypothetical protein GQ53DRAFT_797114 [Thozetella sp. PMI_491]|nr:hypothetical protein GQ53DRAFT_797114 [Thozetella sp. PMI_491]